MLLPSLTWAKFFYIILRRYIDSRPQTDYLLSVWEHTCVLFLLGSDCLLLKISVRECRFTVLPLGSGQCLFGLHAGTHLYSTHIGRNGC